MECKHTGFVELVYQFEDGRTVSRQNRCDGCGEWLSLGPANNSGPHAEAVAIEISAALSVAFGHGLSVPGPCQLRLPIEKCTVCQEIWLTHVIATHGGDPK